MIKHYWATTLLIVTMVLVGAQHGLAQPATGPGTGMLGPGVRKGPFGRFLDFGRRGADSVLNKNGNTPGLERKPPTKRLADPENLESENPAIKKAAEIKKEEDLKKQKIKAIKYLAKIGCGCYDKDGGITEALKVAISKDCTEDVRYEAVKAIKTASEDEACCKCGEKSCCKPELLKTLAQTAFERDEHGCWVEPSSRVRELAVEVLRMCCTTNEPLTIVEDETPPSPVPTPPVPIEGGDAVPLENGNRKNSEELPPAAPTATEGAAARLGPGASSRKASSHPQPSVAAPSVLRSSSRKATLPVGYRDGSQAASRSSLGREGMIVAISQQHGLAHIHFRNPELQLAPGETLRSNSSRRSGMQFEVVEAHVGSAIVRPVGESNLSQIRQGDLVR